MATAERVATTSARHYPVLPLEPGDHLTREEFERRYDAMSAAKKAELIEGVVYMPSPASGEYHGRPHARLAFWLSSYQFHTLGTDVHCESSVRLGTENEPQPDVLLMIEPRCGGRIRFASDGFVEGAPELVAEIAASSVSIDLHAKKRVYERCGVREYVVWRVLDEAIDWFVLRNGQFEQLSPDAEGRVKSEVFPGLWLDPAALVRGDLATVMQVLQLGLASAEHGAFVERLKASRTASS
jgi:Uma2 family endonuclease